MPFCSAYPIDVRFWDKVLIDDADVCWLWCGHRHPLPRLPYGTFRWNRRRNIVAHRAAWIISYGDVPFGLKVLHSCDNPSCVNPNHLFLGTLLDNARDRDSKGRGARGDQSGLRKHPERRAWGDRNGSRRYPEKRPRGLNHWTHIRPATVLRGAAVGTSRLTESDIVVIRESLESSYALAARFAVSAVTIQMIRKRRTWKHIL